MGFRPQPFPVGGMYVKGIGRPTKFKKITRFSVPLLLKRKSTSQMLRAYLTGKGNQSEKHSTSKPNRFATIPSHTLVSPALVLCSATAVGADLAVRPKAMQYMRQVLKRTESLIVPNTSPTQALACADAAEDYWSQSLKIQRQAPKVLSRINEKDSLTISEGAPLAARC